MFRGATIPRPMLPAASVFERTGSETPTAALNDVRLLTEGLVRCDEDSFRTLHTRYFDRVYRYLLVVSHGNEDEARDALMETFTRAVRYARPFDREEALWSWLTVLARSAAIDAGRKRQSYWRLLQRFAAGKIESPTEQFQEGDSRLPELLELALGQLNEADRSLLEGKYFSRCSVRQLAAERHLSEKAVESRLGRARGLVREFLLKELKHEPS